VSTVASSARSWIPRGITLDEAAFASRHRALQAISLLHVPVLALLAVVGGRTTWEVWGPLAAVVVLTLSATSTLSHRARAGMRASVTQLAAEVTVITTELAAIVADA
jgi:hypothetical protein